ncbi:MFS transporter [Arthrobacter sp. NPDC058130]|uniref:MFS transporter n=1 Tax=Arthrobacter sp. NPDC058130 TaxID=3346353 RepID=UPI0036E6BCB7
MGRGGLMIGAQGIVGENVSPRERGRYMGIIGGGVGRASVGGPASNIFITSWDGSAYEWASPQNLGLATTAVIGATLFGLVERKVTEPIIPLHLLRERNFLFPTLAGIAVGVTMFGSMSFLPTHMQMVEHADATQFGMMMIPVVVGIVASSLVTGRLISVTGKCRLYPIIGAAISDIGLVLLSMIGVGTPYWFTALGMLVLGLGVGASLQNLTLIVQNGVPARMLGSATSVHNYFRQIGASLAVSVFGSIFISRFTAAADFGSTVGAGFSPESIGSLTPEVLALLPGPAQAFIAEAFATAMPPIFLYGVPLVFGGLIETLFVQPGPVSDRPAFPEPN